MAFFEVEYLKNGILGTKFLYITNRQSYAIYRVVPLSMTWVTSDTDFKVTSFFEFEYCKNGAS